MNAPSSIHSIYDVPVLSILADHGVVPLQVVAHHLRERHGRDASHLLQCVRELAARGLLTSEHLVRGMGRASRRVLKITPARWRWLEWEGALNPSRGCRLVRGLEVYEALRAHAVATVRAGHNAQAKGLPLRLLQSAAGEDQRATALARRRLPD